MYNRETLQSQKFSLKRLNTIGKTELRKFFLAWGRAMT